MFLNPLVRGYQGCLTDPGAADQARKELVEVGVGYMPCLFIGAAFRAGQLVLHSTPVWTDASTRHPRWTQAFLVSFVSMHHSLGHTAQP